MLVKLQITELYKFLLIVVLLSGCDRSEREPEKLSYLTTDIEGREEVTHVSGTVISKMEVSQEGEVSLAVKVRSDEGEIIEFVIADYVENRIYPLVQQVPALLGNELSHASSAGSSRLCLTGRFFFDSSKRGTEGRF